MYADKYQDTVFGWPRLKSAYDVKVEVTFATAAPLGQKAGIEMWTLGNYFSSVGGCKYVLKSQGKAASLPDAMQGLVAQINQVVEGHGHHPIHVIKTTAEVIDD